MHHFRPNLVFVIRVIAIIIYGCCDVLHCDMYCDLTVVPSFVDPRVVNSPLRKPKKKYDVNGNDTRSVSRSLMIWFVKNVLCSFLWLLVVFHILLYDQ